jgi:hypothetical protein
MATAHLDAEVRFLESKEQPGKICCQIFAEEQVATLGLGGGLTRKFRRMQCSGWHGSKAAAAGDLDAKVSIEGLKLVIL